ncbi:putative c2h2-type zn-finger protein, partial [Operophtera brumata]
QELLGSHPDPPQSSPELFATPELVPVEKVDDVGPSSQGSMPDLNPQPEVNAEFPKLPDLEAEGNESELKNEVNTSDVKHSPGEESPRKHKLKCPYCDKKYSSKQAKSMHIKVRIHVVNTPDVKHSPSEESPRKHKLKCPYCDKKYSSKQAKSMHIKHSPSEESPRKHKLKCPYCDKKYSSKQAKSMHIKVRIHVVNTPDVKHSPGEESPRKHKLKCPYCDKKYSIKQAKSKGERGGILTLPVPNRIFVLGSILFTTSDAVRY